ncbi:hypothetical protein GCM10010320_81970 [Streptomyces caelestis]|nr:hypothetical protein GCM10010320_81970 [Streptomyces caelestis]
MTSRQYLRLFTSRPSQEGTSTPAAPVPTDEAMKSEEEEEDPPVRVWYSTSDPPTDEE